MTRLATALFAVALGALSFPAHADEVTAAAPGIHEHDGFFLQMQPGFAFLALDVPDEDLTVSGAGGGLNLAIGGSPIRNLVLFGEILGQQASSLTLELDGKELDADESATLSFSAIGPGAAYYFGDSGFFVSATLAFATAELKSDAGTNTASGFGARAGVGKEWWVGDQWGLGLGANVFTASLVDDDNEDKDLGATSFALNFSATFQ